MIFFSTDESPFGILENRSLLGYDCREVSLSRVQPVSETPNASLYSQLGTNEIKSDEYDVDGFFDREIYHQVHIRLPPYDPP